MGKQISLLALLICLISCDKDKPLPNLKIGDVFYLQEHMDGRKMNHYKVIALDPDGVIAKYVDNPKRVEYLEWGYFTQNVFLRDTDASMPPLPKGYTAIDSAKGNK